ncbi:MAG: BlaI/MecI/CopY family transcriptional regulator [Chloroflexi bacterium]|nr:BlaI/MecI/CopY family transcriptional regulator [Chloroflexota bacterium]
MESETDLDQEQDLEPDITVFRTDRDGVRKVLGDLEADIMEYIWESITPDRQWLTVRDVYEDFRLHRYIAYTTVMSTMARLGRKHILRARKIPGAYVYTPSLSKEEFISSFVTQILENLLVSFSHSAENYLSQVATEEQTSRLTALKAKMVNLRQEATATAETSDLAEQGGQTRKTRGRHPSSPPLASSTSSRNRDH